jgi:hypothetical protein
MRSRNTFTTILMQHHSHNDSAESYKHLCRQRLELLKVNRDAIDTYCQLITTSSDRLENTKLADLIADAGSLLDRAGAYSRPDLENLLIQTGQSLFSRPLRRCSAPGDIKRVAHITSRVGEIGGHTRALYHWIKTDHKRQYSLVLTCQSSEIPLWLRDAVIQSGGEIYLCPPSLNDAERAKNIFNFLDSRIDAAVIQMFTGDNSGLLPFCRNGGPLAIIYNTADHKAFMGNSIADAIIEIRQSGYDISINKRGNRNCHILPLPIERNTINADSRNKARNTLDVKPTDVLVVSIGSEYKYRPIEGLNFFHAAEKICLKTQNVKLLVIGPENEGDWKLLAQTTNNRVKAVGAQENLKPYYDAADLYIEGFPFGSLTALLDARERGIPCILAPNPVTPPFCSDSPGISDLSQPSNCDDYVSQVIKSCDDITTGNSSPQTSLMASHHDDAWKTTLDSIYSKLPAEHKLPDTCFPILPEPEVFWSLIQQPSNLLESRNTLWIVILEKLKRNKLLTSELASTIHRKAIVSILSNINHRTHRIEALHSIKKSIREMGFSLKYEIFKLLSENLHQILNPKCFLRITSLIESARAS